MTIYYSVLTMNIFGITYRIKINFYIVIGGKLYLGTKVNTKIYLSMILRKVNFLSKLRKSKSLFTICMNYY